jgi:hypothetical protein
VNERKESAKRDKAARRALRYQVPGSRSEHGCLPVSVRVAIRSGGSVQSMGNQVSARSCTYEDAQLGTSPVSP